MFYVYVYKDPDTLIPFYVGKGSGYRKTRHLKETKETTENYLKWCKIQSIKNKKQTPIIEIVFESENENECYIKEKELILLYGRKIDGGVLTNITFDGTPPKDAEKRPRSKEYLNNMSKAKTGKLNPMYGKLPWNKNIKHLKETKEKISIANKGRKYTQEEHKKRNETRGKKYKVVSPEGEVFIVKNLQKWAKEKKLCPCNLRLALVGYKGRTSYKGWTGQKIV